MIRRGRVALGLVTLSLALLATGVSAAEAFDAHGSMQQVYVTGLSPGARLTLLNKRGRRVSVGKADAQGGLLFRDVRPGTGYRVRQTGGATSAALTVLSNRPAPPSTDVYKQTIPTKGYGYMSMRDG